MLRIQQRLVSFSIVSHKIAHNSRDYKRDPVLNFYPVVGLKDIKLGTIQINQPNNQNFLTVEMMGELFRFLNSYEHDHTVENVWIQNRGSMFLGGISYQELANNPDYLDKLYKMTVMFAKINKPTFSLVTGGVRNVGAYVLSMATIALTDHTATLRIDEVSKGFIPVAGGAHRLSRLPMNLGYYLALTGKRLSSDSMARLGFITGIAKEGVTSKQMRAKISQSNLYFREKLRYNMFDKRNSEWEEWTKIINKKKAVKREIYANQIDILKSQENVFAKFAMNQHKIAQFNYENVTNPFNSFSEKPGRNINNYFRMRHEKAFNYLEKEGLVERSEFEDIRLPEFEIDNILKFFQKDSIQEVVKALQSSSSEWAQDTLKNIRKMDPLAATLTFQLLKRAETLTWDQCLDLEYTIAKRLLANSKLELKETFEGSKFILTNQYSSSRIEQIPLQETISQYFSQASTQEQTLQRQVSSHSLLPTKDYIHIPDSARMTLNQQFFNDVHLSNQQREMKRWLEQEKIDYRHKSFNIDLLREKIYEKQEYERVKKQESKRLEFIVNNSRVLNSFVKERYDQLDKMTNQDFEKLLKEIVTKVFNDGIKSRFGEFEKTAEIIGKERKLQIFKNLRKILVKKVVMNGVEIEEQNNERNEFFRGPIYFDKEGKGIYESQNPNLKVHEPLKKLAEEIAEKGTISQEFIENQGAQPIDRHMGLENYISPKENYLKRVEQKIAKRYFEQPNEWNKAYQYKEMVREAAKTSEELAQYLEWDTRDFYNTILNAPETPKTYAEYGQEAVEKMEADRSILKNSMRTESVLYQTLSTQFFANLYNTKPQTTYKSTKFIKQKIIPKFALNKELEKFMVPVLEQVLKHFEDKYFAEALKEKKLEFGEFDKYIYEAQDKEFVEFYQNDILFVYSYFAILKVKEVLHNSRVNGVPQNPEELIAFFRPYGIQFKPDRTVEFMNRVLSRFLFQMLDLHTYTKAKIRLPQSKLLDFLNRTKINREIQKKSSYPLSFESLLLMIGKDRSKLYNKVLQEYIPSEPQFLLQMAHNQTKDLMDDQTAARGSISPNLYVYENSVSQQHLEKKGLVAGFQYYLALFDSIIHRASGKYNFINDAILALDSKKLKEEMGNLINLKETPRQWIERCTEAAIRSFFKARLDYEKSLTKGELLAFDQQYKELLEPENFRLALKYILQNQISQTKVYFGEVRHYSYPKTESEIQEQNYCEIRRSIKNPDAFKRLNNLKMALSVQKEYYLDNKKQVTTPQQKEDLVEEKKEFEKYERFPKETYRRIFRQIYEYGEEKNFDKYLNPLGEKEMDHKSHLRRLQFIDDEKINIKKEEKFTDFDEEIKLLRSTITKNSNSQEIESIYKKLEELL